MQPIASPVLCPRDYSRDVPHVASWLLIQCSILMVLMQMLTPSASGVMGDPWNQQPLCRLQSAPLALLSGLDTALGSGSSTLLLYAALQDKSVHKYQLNMTALTMPSKTKVPLPTTSASVVGVTKQLYCSWLAASVKPSC